MATNVTRTTPYGLKEVADVFLFPVGTSISLSSTYDSSLYAGFINAGTVDPNFIFDTLKVSNIEVASEDTSATGGKGNPELISWSYGKEITFTMTDALFSMATLDLMFGANATVDDDTTQTVTIDSDTFPSNYHIVGLTYMRSQADGKDYPFVFEIPNAKININGSLTMEADGDPTTFEMTIKALKAAGSKELVKFHRIDATVSATSHESNNVK
jgi:hypothetical protein